MENENIANFFFADNEEFEKEKLSKDPSKK